MLANLLPEILVTLLLVVLNGFFVGAEFAIVKVRQSQIDLRATQGNAVAKIAKHIISHMDGYLSACQLGITLASLALGWIGEDVVNKIVISIMDYWGYNVGIEGSVARTASHAISIPNAFSLITVLHIVLGEQVPKTAAIRNPLKATLFVAVPMRIFYTVFKPFIWSLNALSNLTLRLFGLKSGDHNDIHTEEELRMILTESEEGGAIKQSEHELIQNVFEFDDRMVKQIYVPRTRVIAIDIDDDVEQVIDRVVEEGYSRLPVYKDSIDNIIGIIHSKDLIRHIRLKKPIDLNTLLRPAYYVPLGKFVNDLLRELQRQHIQMAIVTNEFGGTEGIVTMEDIIEELVGEIQDEYDEEKPAVEKKSETEYLVNATSSISDVNDLLPIALEEGVDYETVSGLVNKLFDGIPAVNEKKEFGGYKITIMKRFKHSVEQVKLEVVGSDSLTLD
jgi:CBS domain containing-hemolysin-like protein